MSWGNEAPATGDRSTPHDGRILPSEISRQRYGSEDEGFDADSAGVGAPGRSRQLQRPRPGPHREEEAVSDGPGRRLLILGGTWFLGRTLAESALAMGWQVTCFNRGRTGHDVAGTRSVRGDRTNPDDVRRLAEHGPWDAVVDTSVYEPPDALLTARTLLPVASRYVLVSTVSAGVVGGRARPRQTVERERQPRR